MSYVDPEDEYGYDDEPWGDDSDEGSWDDHDNEEDEVFPCPECGADAYADVESCPECGYWITDADLAAVWKKGSASGRIVAIGLWLLGAAVVGWLLF